VEPLEHKESKSKDQQSSSNAQAVFMPSALDILAASIQSMGLTAFSTLLAKLALGSNLDFQTAINALNNESKGEGSEAKGPVDREKYKPLNSLFDSQLSSLFDGLVVRNNCQLYSFPASHQKTQQPSMMAQLIKRTSPSDLFIPIEIKADDHISTQEQSVSNEIVDETAISKMLAQAAQLNLQGFGQINALEEFHAEHDDEALIAQRDVLRIEKKIDLMLAWLASNNIDPPQAIDVEYVFSAQTLQLSFKLDTAISETQLQLVLNLLEGLNAYLSHQSTLYFLPIAIHPLLVKPLLFPVHLHKCLLNSETRLFSLLFDIDQGDATTIEYLEKHIFRLHRRALAKRQLS